jgi:hypothetical protein
MKYHHLYSLIITLIVSQTPSFAATAKPSMEMKTASTASTQDYSCAHTLLTLSDLKTSANVKIFNQLKSKWWLSMPPKKGWIGWSKEEALDKEAEYINILAGMLGMDKTQINCLTLFHKASGSSKEWNETFLEVKSTELAHFEAVFWQLPRQALVTTQSIKS